MTNKKKKEETVEVAGGKLAPREEASNDATKVVTVHIPLDVWKKLMLLKVDGKIKSLNSAVIDAIHLYTEKIK